MRIKGVRESSLTVPLKSATTIVSEEISSGSGRSEQPITSSTQSPPTNLTMNQSTASGTKEVIEIPKGVTQIAPRRIELGKSSRSEVTIGPSTDELDDWVKGLQRRKTDPQPIVIH